MKRNSLHAVAISLALAGSACGVHMVTTVPSPTVVRSYTIGSLAEAAVGDPIFRVQAATQRPAFEALRSVGPQHGWRIQSGDRFEEVGTWPQKGWSVLVNRGAALPLVIDSSGTPVGFQNGSQILKWRDSNTQPLFRRTTAVLPGDGAFGAEIIYSGVSGSTLKASYREYVENLARPAFSQELQYDLAQDSTIAFRSVRIRVVDATNARILFRVLSDDDLPWVKR